MASTCPFTTSPVAFLRALTALRRKGQSFAQSHLGRILRVELIAPELFERRWACSAVNFGILMVKRHTSFESSLRSAFIVMNYVDSRV